MSTKSNFKLTLLQTLLISSAVFVVVGFTVIKVVQSNKSAGSYTETLPSKTAKSSQYKSLVKAMETYEKLEAKGGWKSIRSGDAIEPGAVDPRIPALRTRLAAEGFYDAESGFLGLKKDLETPALYDAKLEKSVLKFQKMHGLEEDGVIGEGTLAVLNESVASKISKIMYSLTEWETYGDMGGTFIWANVPSYTASAYKNGDLDIAMKAIVGNPRTATPVFQDNVEYLMANPKWFLPVSLFKRQKLAKLQDDPGYAEDGNYRIYDRETQEELNPHTVDWSDPNIATEIQMVQDAGPTNALGEVKIMFPNSHSVYLHGTPDVKLFDRTTRALSSGCIRLEDPRKMVKWISSVDKGVNYTEFNKAMDASERKRFTLAEEIPVYITYIPVTVDEDGQAMFWKDIYSKLPKSIAVDKFYDSTIPA
ncbi:MAG: L,D-transpeptidase family protein [Alphaproteobacteria bacterium]